MVDLDRLHQRLQLLTGYLHELRRLRDLPVAEYLQHEVYAGRYLVQVAAQTCIDLANHVIASEGWRSPRDFGDSFTVLQEYGVIDDALAGRLRGLAGLRNRLVHVYDDWGRRGSRVPDAHLAALAIEHGATLCSADEDFGRVPSLVWMNPIRP